MSKRATLFAVAVLAFVGLSASRANADQFQISWTGAYGTGSATVNATYEGSGDYLVTSLTGTQGSRSISLLAPGSYGSNGNDIYPTSFFSPLLDFSGLSFTDGRNDFNIFYDTFPGSMTYRECSSAATDCDGHYDGKTLSSLNITRVVATPEPASLFLLGSGLAGIAGFLRRRKK